MLGWILGAQPTATTQYPIVHLPRYFEDKDKDDNKDNNKDSKKDKNGEKDFLISVPVTTPLRPWSPHLNQGPAQQTNQPTNQQTNLLLEVPTHFKGSSLPFLICSFSSFRSSLAQTLLQTLVELVSPQLLPKTNKHERKNSKTAGIFNINNLVILCYMESYILQCPIKQQTAVKTLLSRLQALSLGIRVYVLTSAISSCQIKTRCKKATFDLNCAPAVKTANFDTAREKKIYGGKWRSADIGNEKESAI